MELLLITVIFSVVFPVTVTNISRWKSEILGSM